MPAQVAKNTNGLNAQQGNSLVDILVNQGALSSESGKSVKLAEIQTGKPQEKIIKEQNLVNEEKLARAIASLHNIPFVDLNTTPVQPEALAILPQEVAERFFTFPISVNKSTNELVLAMANPLDLAAIEFIGQKTGMRVKPQAAEFSKIEQMISAHYVTSLTQEVTAALKDVAPDREKLKTLDIARTGLIREEKIAEIVSHVLEFAVKARASDVHIEPMEKSTRVRYRIDGILHEKLTMPRELHEALVSRIKILAGMKIDEKRIPQDGRFNFKTGNEEVDLRVSSLPATWGEKIVLRLLQKTGGIPSLDDLGLRGRGLKNLQDAILRPHGIILICGPTGSGKTTTLYSIISKINTPKVNIITLEDPIEYKIPGVNQVQVNPVAGLTFSSGLRSLLRQDPDIILVGEIRDKETADLAIQASLTGHLVFSTLHTNDSAGALPRLLDMGVEPYLLASSMTAVAAQRVIRRVHLECKKGYKPDPNIVQNIKDVLGPIMQEDKDFLLYKGEGDPECNNTGYFGRIGIFEVLPISEKIAKLILERAPASAMEKKAREEGMISLKQDGYLRVVEGITTMDEVLRVAQE